MTRSEWRKLSGDAKVQHGSVNLPLEHDSRVAERAVRHRQRHTVDVVVDDLVPDQDAQGIGPRFVGDHHGDHRLDTRKTVMAGNGNGAGIVDGRNAVPWRSARQNVSEIDRVPGEVGPRPLVAPQGPRWRAPAAPGREPAPPRASGCGFEAGPFHARSRSRRS